MQSALDRIKTALADGKTTQSALAEKSGVLQSVISEWVTGKTQNPRYDTVTNLLSALDELAPEPEPEPAPKPRRKPAAKQTESRKAASK